MVKINQKMNNMDNKLMFKFGKFLTILLMALAIVFWIISMERCGLTTLCSSHNMELIGNMFALSSVLIAISNTPPKDQ